MPFKSQAQRGFMYAKHPEIAKRWEKETPEGKLPEHVSTRSVAKDLLAKNHKKK
jgi:hypothetical protein